MAIADITKPMALDETLQDTNTALDLLGKDTTLQAIVTALGALGINTIGNLSQLTTEQKTSLVAAINEVNGKSAENIGYDNTESGLEADDVQGAIDELKGEVDEKSTVEASTTNGNIVIDDVETQVYDDSDIQNKIDASLTSVSGNPISINGLKSNQLAINPIITLEPIQAGSGTPSPSNIRAISGYDKVEVLSCGKNLFDKSKATLNKLMTPTGESTSNNSYYSALISIKGNTEYYLTNTYGSSSSYSSIHYDKYLNVLGSVNVTGTGVTSGKITSLANSAFMIVNGATASIDTMQVEEGSSATTYEPYHKTTDLSESLGQTVYGGTLDVRTGKLSGDATEYVFTGNETWVSTWEGQAYSCSCLTSNPGVSNANQNNVYKCEIADPKSANNLYANLTGIAVNGVSIFISADLYASISSFTGKKVIYKGATPFTIQLTPHEISLLKDYAYVSTNGTNIALDYHNGELASLSDVSQLSETVNELGKMVIRHKQVKLSSSVIGTSFSPTSIRIDKLGNLFGADCANQKNILSISVMQINVTPASMFICGYYNDYLWIASNQSCTLTGDAVFNITYIAN